MKDVDIEQARATARILAGRVQTDPTFLESILQDPISVLTSAGLPADFVEEFLVRAQLSEVQGYTMLSCGLTVIM
jgi:hypothetical protein